MFKRSSPGKESPSSSSVLKRKRASHEVSGAGIKSTSDPQQLQNLFYDPPANSKEFKRLKFKNKLYTVGDTITIENFAEPANKFIAKILKIRSFLISHNRSVVGCLVQWYYRKSDLKLLKHRHMLSDVSENEVFVSNHEDTILADSISGICNVVSLQDYEEKEEFRFQSNCYFTRASYDIKKGTLEPPMESWYRYCLCRRPVNPDIPVIQCESCEEWFHFGCVGLSASEAEKIEIYYCPQCSADKKVKEDSSTDAQVDN